MIGRTRTVPSAVSIRRGIRSVPVVIVRGVQRIVENVVGPRV
jgi:hypothetical protein